MFPPKLPDCQITGCEWCVVGARSIIQVTDTPSYISNNCTAFYWTLAANYPMDFVSNFFKVWFWMFSQSWSWEVLDKTHTKDTQALTKEEFLLKIPFKNLTQLWQIHITMLPPNGEILGQLLIKVNGSKYIFRNVLNYWPYSFVYQHTGCVNCKSSTKVR